MNAALFALLRRGVFRRETAVALVVAAVFCSGTQAATGEAKGGNSAPVLVSTKGPAVKWKGLDELQKFAAKGDPQACFELGTRYLEGNEVTPDMGRAIELFEQAAKGGVADASFRLGKIYFDGLNAPADYSRALEYYLVAAQSGVLEAEHNIGAMLVSAKGVKRDFVEGLAWLIVATKSGDDGEAEARVRTRLAKRPADIQAAEDRAAELLQDLHHATVRAVFPGAAVVPPVIDAPPKPILSVPVGPKVEKPPVAMPKIEAPTPLRLLPPAAPEIPAAPAK